MKIRSLLLGSLAAAGLSTGAFAADPAGLGVLTSLDVCDALGLSGLTISSDTNCLQITGGVKYEFQWGSYRPGQLLVGTAAGNVDVIDGNSATDEFDWNSKVESFLKFVGTADSDFGPAKAVIKIKDVQQWVVQDNEYVAGKNAPGNIQEPFDVDGDGIIEGPEDLNGNGVIDGGEDNNLNGVLDPAETVTATVEGTGGDHTFGPIFDEAYVSIGDSTVIMAGKKGSIIQNGDDEPFNWLGLFNSDKVDTGVKWGSQTTPIKLPDGGHVIQVVSDLGNGLSIGVGLENLNGAPAEAGTAVGYLAYAGDGITAHVTGIVGGILDGNIENYAVHAGFTGTFDMFKIRAAGAYGYNVLTTDSTFNVLASAEATFDIFKIAISGEAAGGSAEPTGYGVGASATADIVDGVAINVGGRYFDAGNGDTGYQIAAKLVASVTETLTLSGEVGYYGDNAVGVMADPDDSSNVYGAVELAWAPGGGFTSSVKAEANSLSAYRLTFKAAKNFE